MGWPGECGKFTPGRPVRQSTVGLAAEQDGISTDFNNMTPVQLTQPAAEAGLAPVSLASTYVAPLAATNVTQLGSTVPNTLAIQEAGLYTIAFHVHCNIPAESATSVNFIRTSIFSQTGTYNANRMAEASGLTDVTTTFTGYLNAGDVLWFGVSSSNSTASGPPAGAGSTAMNIYGYGGAGSEQTYIRVTKIPIML